MARQIALLLLAGVIASGAALAQTGGQLWVRSFEDRNGNGVRDAGEPLLTRGVSVNLIDAEGVIIASALLDNSPNAAQGLVGFQLLPPGEYSVQVTSAQYTPTTSDTFTATVSDTGVPPVLEFGAQPVEAPAASQPEASAPADGQQVLIASAAALAVMCGMVIVGFLIYMLFLRRRMLDARVTTGTLRPVAADTGRFPAVSDTGQFRRPVVADEVVSEPEIEQTDEPDEA